MLTLNTRLLIVDDSGTARKMMVLNCKKMGFTDVIEAADGNLAFEALKNSSPEVGLVISDWSMPNATGLDFLVRVRADEKFKKLPFVMLSAEAVDDQIRQAVKAGANGYLVKPFTVDAFKAQLARMGLKFAQAA